MLTQEQIEQFVEQVDEAGYGIEEDHVVSTADTLTDFNARWGRADEIDDGLHIWEKVQSAPGQPRRTLCVRDFGDVRAACTI